MKKPLFRLLRVMCVLVLATLCLGILVISGYCNIAVPSFCGKFKNQRFSMIKVECFVSFFFFFTFLLFAHSFFVWGSLSASVALRLLLSLLSGLYRVHGLRVSSLCPVAR